MLVWLVVPRSRRSMDWGRQVPVAVCWGMCAQGRLWVFRSRRMLALSPCLRLVRIGVHRALVVLGRYVRRR